MHYEEQELHNMMQILMQLKNSLLLSLEYDSGIIAIPIALLEAYDMTNKPLQVCCQKGKKIEISLKYPLEQKGKGDIYVSKI